MEGTTHDGRNALVVGPLPRQGETDTRHGLLSATDPRMLNVLEITYTRSPAAIYEEWCERLETRPRRLFIISLAGRAKREWGSDRLPPGVLVESVNPYDLTELGMRWQRCLRLLRRAEGEVVVDFDSVTSLLQFVDERPAYRFLHMLTGQAHKLGAHAQFYLDPNAHEERTCHVFQTTFDEVRQPTFARFLRSEAPVSGEAATPNPASAPGTREERRVVMPGISHDGQ